MRPSRRAAQAHPSLVRRLRRVSIGSCVLLVAGYRLLLEWNLDHGFELAVGVRFDALASRAAERVRSGEALPVSLPDDPRVSLYIDGHGPPAPIDSRNMLGLADGVLGRVALDGFGPINRAMLLYASYSLPDGTRLTLVERFAEEDMDESRLLRFDTTVNGWHLAGAVALLLAVAALLLLARRASRETARLDAWVGNLDVDNLPEAPPAFVYREHRALAGRVLDALAREAIELDRRRRFLDFASHELRTPLAVASANRELVTSLLARSARGGCASMPEGTSNALERPVERLGRALEDMRRLTTTLLWLARDDRALPSPEPVDVPATVHACVAARRHAVAGDAVDVTLAGDAPGTGSRPLPRTPFELVVSNLVENALRHAGRGTVRVEVRGGAIRVSNPVERVDGDAADELGFGLGLQLVDSLCARLGWSCRRAREGGSFVALLRIA